MIPCPIRNYRWIVPDKLARSGQPDAAGWRWLVAQGFKSVVNLRAEAIDSGAEGLPPVVRGLPIPDGRPPTVDQARQFLAWVDDPSHWPCLVHCLHGSGRTGAMVAIYQVLRLGWDVEKAIWASRRAYPLWWRLLHPRGALDDGQAAAVRAIVKELRPTSG